MVGTTKAGTIKVVSSIWDLIIDGYDQGHAIIWEPIIGGYDQDDTIHLWRLMTKLPNTRAIYQGHCILRSLQALTITHLLFADIGQLQFQKRCDLLGLLQHFQENKMKGPLAIILAAFFVLCSLRFVERTQRQQRELHHNDACIC